MCVWPAATHTTQAYAGTTSKTVNVGASHISVPSGGWTSGSYFYFGSYNNNAIKYRVLSNSNNTMLIDSDTTLWTGIFSNNRVYQATDGNGGYANSTIRGYLKDGNDSSGNSLFTSVEKSALVSTDLAAASAYVASRQGIQEKNYDDASTGNLAFVLSAQQVSDLYPSDSAANKTGASDWYWTRSTTNSVMPPGVDAPELVDAVYKGQLQGGGLEATDKLGIAPASNIDTSKIFLTTSPTFDKTNSTLTPAENTEEQTWKATLTDTSKTITAGQGTIDANNLASVPVTLAGSDISQASVVITSGDISSTDTEILYYGALSDIDTTLTTEQTGTFTLPANLPSGYKVYVMAEDVNTNTTAGSITDYASTPAEVTFTQTNDGAIKAINLGASKITVPSGGWTKDDGNYITFGTYQYLPTYCQELQFRVLTNDNGVMLLDCNKHMWKDAFSESQTTQLYIESDIIQYLKDGKGIGYESDYTEKIVDLFSSVEKGALISTNLEASTQNYQPSRLFDDNPGSTVQYFDDASTDNLAFLLTANQINTLYPAKTDSYKQGAAMGYWLRSATTYSNTNVGIIDQDGGYKVFTSYWLKPDNLKNVGVAPAVNLDTTKVLFTTEKTFDKTASLAQVSDASTKAWKVTLVDDALNLALSSVTKEGNVVTVPYTVSGDRAVTASQVSVLITSGDIASDSSEILYYGKLADVSASTTEGSATFTLPEDLPSGYKVYVMAEDVNSTPSTLSENISTGSITDYASKPVEIELTQNFAVQFFVDGTEQRNLAQTVEKGSTANDPSSQLSKEGYTLDGWYSDESCTGNTFDFSTEIAENTKLYAKWVQNPFTVTFDSDGGSAVAEPTVKVEAGNTVAKPANPTREGFTFKYWALNDKEFDFKTPITSDITLKAVWDKVTPTPSPDPDPDPSPDPDPDPEPEAVTLSRLAGENADQTAAAISKAGFESSETAILARMDDFADALGASGLAGTLNCPILLTGSYELSDAAATELKNLGVKQVYIIGGPGALFEQIDADLADLGVKSTRVYGDYAWDTSLACAKAIEDLDGNEKDEAIVAMSFNFQDALSISSYAYKYKVPLILENDSAQLTSDAISFIKNNTSGTIYVPGGTGAVPESSVEGVFTGRTIQRLWGYDGYDTSNQIASYMTNEGLLSANTVAIASGGQKAHGVDALAGAALVGKQGGVMLLANAEPEMEDVNLVTIDAGKDSEGEASFLTANKDDVESAFVLGGTVVAPEDLFTKVKTILGV